MLHWVAMEGEYYYNINIIILWLSGVANPLPSDWPQSLMGTDLSHNKTPKLYSLLWRIKDLLSWTPGCHLMEPGPWEEGRVVRKRRGRRLEAEGTMDTSWGSQICGVKGKPNGKKKEMHPAILSTPCELMTDDQWDDCFIPSNKVYQYTRHLRHNNGIIILRATIYYVFSLPRH